MLDPRSRFSASHLRPPCSITYLTNAWKEQCFPDKGIRTRSFAFIALMFLDTPVRKLGKRFPHVCLCLTLHSPYILHKILNAHQEGVIRASRFIMWQLDMSRISLGWASTSSPGKSALGTRLDERGILFICVDRLDLDISRSSKVYLEYFMKN